MVGNTASLFFMFTCEVNLICDGKKCKDFASIITSAPVDTDDLGRVEAEAEATRCGWKKVGDKWFCPKCQK